MANEHAKEPWNILDEGDLVVVENSSIGICSMSGEFYSKSLEHDAAIANARRIVACVNFCAGISTEVLESAESNHA